VLLSLTYTTSRDAERARRALLRALCARAAYAQRNTARREAATAYRLMAWRIAKRHENSGSGIMDMHRVAVVCVGWRCSAPARIS